MISALDNNNNNNSGSSYQTQSCSITSEMVDQEQTHHQTFGRSFLDRKKHILLAVGVIFAVATVVVSQPSWTASSAPAAVSNTVDLLGSPTPSSAAASCTFEECSASNCNTELAPFTCLWHNGGPHGGCSPTPWTKESCTTQCDLSGCDSLDIPDSVPDCNQDCPDEWCSMGRLCGSDVSYQCTVGASAFGCSSDPYQWTFRVSYDACSSCCDINTC